MSENTSFIETQFPVSKISKESFKERKANYGQTLTGLGKWWGRKPLVLIRAAILGCLIESSSAPEKDMQFFSQLLGIDSNGLLRRKTKAFTVKQMYNLVLNNENLASQYLKYFEVKNNRIKINKEAPREEIEVAIFNKLNYDQKMGMVCRPEQMQELPPSIWEQINAHFGTNANNIRTFVAELSQKKFGHNVKVGDCFCGGGSIPFEAARIGCDVYASDLNPVAGILTWADINICGADDKKIKEIRDFQNRVYENVDDKIKSLGIETNEKGDRAVSYIYCMETTCPECGCVVPLSPSWIIGKGSKTIAKLHKNGNKYDIEIKMGATEGEMLDAASGTIVNKALKCPCCGKTTPISALRNDRQNDDGSISYGLRRWEKGDFIPRSDDRFKERLYAIRYEGKEGRYYRSPNSKDIENENKIIECVSENIEKWQDEGLVPSLRIEEGYNTTQLIRERGWQYWHQLFTARQILVHELYVETVMRMASDRYELVTGLLGVNKILNWDSKLCQWNSGASQEGSSQTFMNQALNTMWNWTGRGNILNKKSWEYDINNYPFSSVNDVELKDARDINDFCDIWITDPPYADAVNYHELSEFFLAWDSALIKKAFPDWYTDSKRVLAVRGDEHFSQTMIEIYSNLTKHMPDKGMQIVMFTHSDPAVWAQLAIIMWRAGLRVTAAWNIATETDASGLKNGNYVKGTVLLVLRKQTGNDVAFLDEINVDIREEVKRQIASMQQLDDKEEPNFSDPDYVLAAYAASLKVLTSYKEIEDLDLDHELNKAISDPSHSQVVTIIENAKKIAYDCVIPADFDNYLWRDLSNAEKFYVKGLESEKHGNYQVGTYQEFARGFSIGGYSQLMASEKANTARLKTPVEMADRSMNDVPDFQDSLTRTVFEGIYVAVKNDMNPKKGLDFIKNDIPNYWDRREMIIQILSFLVDIRDIGNMQPHWTDSAVMADHLLTVVRNDSI